MTERLQSYTIEEISALIYERCKVEAQVPDYDLNYVDVYGKVGKEVLWPLV